MQSFIKVKWCKANFQNSGNTKTIDIPTLNWGNECTEWLSNWPGVTELTSRRTEIQPSCAADITYFCTYSYQPWTNSELFPYLFLLLCKLRIICYTTAPRSCIAFLSGISSQLCLQNNWASKLSFQMVRPGTIYF